jgi:DNA-binding MarR family transcriptional regulator
MTSIVDGAGSTMYLLQHIGTILERQFDQALLEQLGIGTSQYRILLALEAHPDVSQKRLATNLGQTEASISRQVRVLQTKQLINTQVHPHSRRERVTSLSPKGVTVIAVAKELYARVAASLLDTLNERQQKAFRDALSDIHNISCSPDTPRSCDHELDLLEQQTKNSTYVLAIS